MADLFVTDHTPTLGVGRALRSYAIIRALAAHGPVDVLYVHFGADQRAANPSCDGLHLLDDVLSTVSIPVGIGTFGVDDAVRAAKKGADMVAIGHPLISGPNPLEALKRYASEVRSNWRPRNQQLPRRSLPKQGLEALSRVV